MSIKAARAWSTPDDIVRKVRRCWDDGSVLSAYARGDAWEPTSVPLRGPLPSELAERLDDVWTWVERLERGSRRGGRSTYRLQYRSIGGRAFGSNELPARAWIDDYEQAWTLLSVRDQVRRYAAAVDFARNLRPSIAQ